MIGKRRRMKRFVTITGPGEELLCSIDTRTGETFARKDVMAKTSNYEEILQEQPDGWVKVVGRNT